MVQIRVSPDHVLPDVEMTFKKFGSGGIRTHAPEETGALNQRLRPSNTVGPISYFHFFFIAKKCYYSWLLEFQSFTDVVQALKA